MSKLYSYLAMLTGPGMCLFLHPFFIFFPHQDLAE